MKYQLDFTNKVACVTGAGRGIGKSIALGFGSLGAHVFLVSRNLQQLESTAKEIITAGGKATPLTCDLSKVDEINKLVTRLKEKTPQLDILVNDHGANIKRPSETYREEDWDITLSTNLKSYFFLSTAVAREFMIPQQAGKIVNLASIGGLNAIVKSAAYCSSKGGVVLMTKVLGCEWAKYNIQVNAVGPAYIKTELVKETLKNEDFVKNLYYRTPAARCGEPEEVAAGVLFLASNLANFITGHTLMIDGGFSAFGI
jgi:NAD(P)-dependent dehydrogenase (short-subunit alcohol dehydrogenase family)